MSVSISSWPKTNDLPVWKCVVSGLIFEAVWLVCVLNPSALLLVLLTALNLGVHLLLFHGPSLSALNQSPAVRSLIWLFGLAFAGIVMDGLLFKTGVFLADPAPFAVPLWLACLWLNFALALRFAFVFLHRRLLMSAVFGFTGGPLSYLIGAKIGGEVALSEPLWFTLAILALLWAIFLPLAVYSLERIVSRPQGDAQQS